MAKNHNCCRSLLAAQLAQNAGPSGPTCSGEGYASFTIGDGALIITGSTTGFQTLRDSEGNLTTDSGFFTPKAGTYCFYSSDSEGVPSGSITSLVITEVTAIILTGLSQLDDLNMVSTITDPDFSGNPLFTTVALGPVTVNLDLSDNPLMRTITIESPALETVTLHPSTSLSGVNIQGGSLDATTVDIICNALDPSVTGIASGIYGGTNAAPTAASLANRIAYIGNGNTLTTN